MASPKGACPHVHSKLVTDIVALYAQRRKEKGHVYRPDTLWQQEFEDAFPYEETDDQQRVIAEIKADMESEKVMDRLVCGDVGFGKTEIAFRAMFKCVMEGKQAAMLAQRLFSYSSIMRI